MQRTILWKFTCFKSSLWLGLLALLLSQATAEGAAEKWQQARELMKTVSPEEPDEKNNQAFHVLPGYQVERLFIVPREKLGSWVALTSDPQGRLYASDQQEKGLVRISPAATDGSTETVVEKVPAALSGAQGLLWAFDALYAVCNGGGFHGLFRLTDTDGDSLPDHVEKLRDIAAGGEHGAHNILLSPDGTRLFIICGNHTKLPFQVTDVTAPQTLAGIRPDQRRVKLSADGTSRLPTNWDEDMIIRRMWDGNGHATGRLAPGGYIVSTDPDGKEWELWSAGYRNPYDFGFNADGEIFAYDADMEWDFGMPWYRPTRVNHATSGSELGWRSGTAKWPASFPDSLPAAVDIGPGSPVGAAFGYGTKFPAKYQKAFYICDWTFGTMYAIHLTPAGSTYRAEKEEFVSRNALPLTDMTIGKDGAIYFAVGGRGGQSELYRVSYVGEESTATVDGRNQAGAAERKLRHELEAFHAPQADPAAAIELALTNLGHTDRFIRYAARIALEHQPVDDWQERALAQTSPDGLITGAIAVARQAEPSSQVSLLTALDRLEPAALDRSQQLDLVRAYELALIRLGEPSTAVKNALSKKFLPLFPVKNSANASAWIWSNEHAHSTPGECLTLQKKFTLAEPTLDTSLVAAIDNSGKVFLDGNELVSCADWMKPVAKSLPLPLQPGEHTITVIAVNQEGPAAIKLELELRRGDGSTRTIATDGSWEYKSTALAESVRPTDGAQPDTWNPSAVVRSQEIWARAESSFSNALIKAKNDNLILELNRALSSLLVAVRAPGIVSKLVGLLATENNSSGRINLATNETELARLATRNTQYGRAVTGVLDNRTDLLQIHYAYVLRTINEKDAWSLANRKDYFDWLDRARHWTGGNSYRKFLVNIEDESLAGLSDTDKLALETLGARKPYMPPPLPKPEGPGQKWTVETVLSATTEGFKPRSRNFAHGKRTFEAARCVVCHRFSGDGGATGPDLTQAAGRFKLKDLIEAIVEPSKAVSDQYQAHVIQTASGKVHTGRIISEDDDQITVVTDPEDASKFVVVQRNDIDEMMASKQSLMPAGLLDTLNEAEVLDLLAYTLSRGNRRDARFKR